MRLGNNLRDLDLVYLDQEDLIHIEVKSKVLSFDECLEFLCIPPAEVPAEELDIAKRIWRKGRVSGLNKAGEKLFASMDMRGGGAVAFDYLKQLSGTFSAEITPTKSAAGFVFNVVMPEDEEKS